MNCTKEEFAKTVHSKHPHKWMSVEISPVTALETLFALDTAGECHLDFYGKYKVASHIWTKIGVMKDQDGLFTPIATNTAALLTHTYNFQAAIPIDFGDMKWIDFPPAGKGQTKLNRCTCGTHAVGSDSHSS